MSHEYADQVIDYVNGNLSEREEKAFLKHLEECQECADEVKELQELMEDLPYSVEPSSPPPGMKERVLGHVFAEEEVEVDGTSFENKQEESKEKKGNVRNVLQRNWTKNLLAAALFLSLAGNAYLLAMNGDSSSEFAEGIDEIKNKVVLQGEQTGGATASIIQQDNDKMLVVEADKLDSLQGDEVYQVWLIKGDTPIRAGSFTVNDAGEGAVAYALNKQTEDEWDTIAISKEPDASSETPQGTVILSSEL
ncbi:hypothetical protein N781_04430 [Pontibacillus halophilus JSM 076056 = DSM 19796]|uniref:Anti-sigma-W factor RsiW n=1 Tax=Pontibacillus halophilus JSM 076056 = DSM 19796 TaxID=1385510 RepID=A0A0A5GH08_9BACI|nr:anti-sigma factor [Pontibacillus halophilus]KGX91319.1 hypothetical protein N781_04430 [Pontibacillus halophilus JSM 076056 = DSM 19796]